MTDPPKPPPTDGKAHAPGISQTLEVNAQHNLELAEAAARPEDQKRPTEKELEEDGSGEK